MQEVMESMGLPTLKERSLGPRDQGIVYWHVPVGRPKKHAYQLLYKCYGRDARASHGELSIQRFVHYKVTCCSLERALPRYATTADDVRGRVVVFGQFIGRGLIL